MPSTETQIDLATEIEGRVVALWTALSRQVPGGLSRTAASVLGTLRREGPQRVTALAVREHVAQPSMSVLLQRLEKRGLVERAGDPDDRRACRVALTEAGAEVLERRAQDRAAWLRERLQRLDGDARATIERALPHLDALLHNRQEDADER